MRSFASANDTPPYRDETAKRRRTWDVGGLGGFVVEEEFLLAGDGLAVAGGGGKRPSLDSGEDCLIDGWAEALGDFGVGDLAGFIDDDVNDDVSAGVGGERGFGPREEGGEGDGDVAAAERVGAGGGG